MPRGLAGRSWAVGLIANLKRCWAAYLTWRRQQAAIAQLWSMSDTQLRDIGLTRTEIIAAVKGEAVRYRAFRHREPLLP
jgi:uncharacterized protein YjiS (DUF1127 family)